MRYDFRIEDTGEKAYDSRLMARLLTYARPYSAWIVLSIVLLLMITATDLARPYLVKVAIDNYIVGSGVPAVAFPAAKAKALFHLARLYFGIVTTGFLLNYAQAYLLQYTGQRIIYDIRRDLFSHLQKMSLSFFDRNPVGRLVTRITNDTEALNQMYTGVLVNLFKDIFLLAGIIVVMLRLNLKVALVNFTIIPLVFLSAYLYRRIARAAYREVRSKLARLNASLQENISGMRIIQIFNRQQQTFVEFDQLNREHYLAGLKELTAFAVFRPSMDLIYSLALALLIWYGGGQVVQGALQFGVLYAFINYTEQFFRPINDLTEKYNILQSAMASSERIFGLLDEKEGIPNPDVPRSLPAVEGKIEFDHVWFAYNPGEWVLKDVCFTINPGETVAIVGPTGAGKTSIISLITRLYDIQKGQIRLDGVDIRQLDKEKLRRHIGVVLQDVFLFTGDIMSNIRLNNLSIPDEKVKKVAQYVNAHHFIQKLPHGYHQKVTERGSTLSTGQRQLLAFARALAFDPRILILDEATSNIDTETEALIQDALQKITRGRTTIVIAHRLSTIQRADKIIVMHKGQVREMGTHAELLSKKGLYYRLHQLQYKEAGKKVHT